jgi:pimeloyl-ACP methyl ester carboxylesterase
MLGGAVLVGLTAQRIFEIQAVRRFPPPGRMVEVGTAQLHLVCQGEGSPTVVFISGWPDTHLVWQKVQPQAAARVQTCSYDRAGLGWSDEPAGRSDWSGETMARELNAVLSAAQIEPPYILVGHSLGGAVARIYAGLYPDHASGLVLVDPAVEENFSSQPAEFQALQARLASMLQVGRAAAPFGLTRLVQPDGFTHSSLPDPLKPASREITLRTQSFRTAYAERRDLSTTLGQAERLAAPDYPVIVLASRRSISPTDVPLDFPVDASNAIHLEVLQHLSSRLPQAELVIAEHSDHYIQLNEPDLVLHAIQRLLPTPQAAAFSVYNPPEPLNAFACIPAVS